MNRSITINNIPLYIQRLSRDHIVYFPIKNKHEITFTNDISQLDKLNFGLPHIPPKKYFLPAKETILELKNKTLNKHTKNKNKKILFGIHPQDIKALTIIKKIFLKADDPIYKNHLDSFYIIGLGEYTFIHDFEYDIFFKSNADTYDILLKNPEAEHLIKYNNLFTKTTFTNQKNICENDPLFLDEAKLAMVVEESYDHPIWDDLAQIDLSCGICTYICPMCYCFETHDVLDLNCANCAKRDRRWSSCFQSDFFETSDHNFRSKLRDRIYNWYHHKFVRMPREIGHIGCVDCGRCIRYCPAKINFKTVLKTLVDDYDKKN